jgi:hypothetical protein
VSSACFEHRSVHLHEDLYMQLCGISVMHRYKQYGRRKDVCDIKTAYMKAWQKYHKTARTSLPEDEHLDVRIKHILRLTRLLIWIHDKHHETACTKSPENEYLNGRNMSKTL